MVILRHWTSLCKRALASRCFLRSSLNQNSVTVNELLQQKLILGNSLSVSNVSQSSPGLVILRGLNNAHKKQRSAIGRVNNEFCEFREFSTGKKLPIIYLFTKEGCTLCDVAVEALKPHMHRFILEEVDIELPENEKWYDMYKYDIPVFHIYEEFLFKHRVDFDALERGLAKYKDGYDVSK